MQTLSQCSISLSGDCESIVCVLGKTLLVDDGASRVNGSERGEGGESAVRETRRRYERAVYVLVGLVLMLVT